MFLGSVGACCLGLDAGTFCPAWLHLWLRGMEISGLQHPSEIPESESEAMEIMRLEANRGAEAESSRLEEGWGMPVALERSWRQTILGGVLEQNKRQWHKMHQEKFQLDVSKKFPCCI